MDLLRDPQETIGTALLVEVLRQEGVRFVFGNPGTTEMPVVRALEGAGDITYVLGLQEASVVAMAAGYATATGRPAVVNLHTAGGLGHAMGAIVHARIARTPLVITAGQQDTRHSASDPLLYGDLVALAAPAVKWAREVPRVEDIPMLLRRAFREAATPPQGPVFLSLPMNVVQAPTTLLAGPPSLVRRGAAAPALDELTGALARVPPGRLALVAGDEVCASGAETDLVAVAEGLGAPVFAANWPGRIPFPTSHPLWAGVLPVAMEQIRHMMEAYDALLILGGNPFIPYLYSEAAPVPPACDVYQISSEEAEIGRVHRAALGLVGDLKASLAGLRARIGRRDQPEQLAQPAARLSARRQELLARLRVENQNLTPFTAAAEVVMAAGPDTPIVDEAPVTMNEVRAWLNAPVAGQYYSMRSGILGWGMPASVGISLGFDRRPVLALAGDGSALYSPQAMWTAVRQKAPVTFVIMNNQAYGILKSLSGDIGRPNSTSVLDLVDPPIDFQALARSFGLPARVASRPGEVEAAVRTGLRSGHANLVEVRLED